MTNCGNGLLVVSSRPDIAASIKEWNETPKPDGLTDLQGVVNETEDHKPVWQVFATIPGLGRRQYAAAEKPLSEVFSRFTECIAQERKDGIQPPAW